MEKETESLLQALSSGATLESVEAALEKMKREKEMKDFAIEQFGGEPKFEKKKKGDKIQELYRYSTRVDGVQKSFTGKTEMVVYQKVWDYFHTGTTSPKKNATLKDVFTLFFEKRESDQSLSYNTVRYDLITWNKYFENHRIAKMPIKSITIHDLEPFFGEIYGKGKLKPKAARKPLTLLTAIYAFAIPTFCEQNLALLIDFGSYKFNLTKDESFFTVSEELKLLKYVSSLKQDVYTLAIRLDFCFNLRIGELRALTWEDYDEEEGVLHIHHQIIKDKIDGKFSWYDVPYCKGAKESGIRDLPVSSEARRILGELRKINGKKHYILQGMHGAKHPISTEHFDDHMKRYCEAIGIPYHASHKVRYLGITKLYEAGVDETIIQRTAGHSTVDMTRKYNKDRRKLAIDTEQWEALFGAKE